MHRPPSRGSRRDRKPRQNCEALGRQDGRVHPDPERSHEQHPLRRLQSRRDFARDGSTDSTAKVWDVQTGDCITTFSGQSKGVSSVAFSPNGLHVLSDGGDKTARIRDARTGTELRVLKGHTDHVDVAVFSPDGIRILTGSGNPFFNTFVSKAGSEDRTVRLWDAKTGTEVLNLKGDQQPVLFAHFTRDGTRLITGDRARTKVWDSSSLQR